jgi:hypothetical protein
MKLPDSDMVADSTLAFEVFVAHMVIFLSMRIRFPVVSSSKIASLDIGEFLIGLRKKIQYVRRKMKYDENSI